MDTDIVDAFQASHGDANAPPIIPSPYATPAALDMSPAVLSTIIDMLNARATKKGGWKSRFEQATRDSDIPAQSVLLSDVLALTTDKMRSSLKLELLTIDKALEEAETFVDGLNADQLQEWLSLLRDGVELGNWNGLIARGTFDSVLVSGTVV
jgi:hypothetical protein